MHFGVFEDPLIVQRIFFDFSFQLVFLDADCRPMFVSASSGLIAASDFDVAMFSRREGDQQQPLPSCRRNDRSESPLGWPIDPPDSDADDPWG